MGAQQALTITCAACKTCPFFFGVVGSAVEHMKKPLSVHTVNPSVVQASRKNCCQFTKYHQRPNAPWRRTSCMQVYSLRNAIHAAWFQQRIAKHAWENWIPAAIAPARHDRERRGIKRNDSDLRAASEHCVASRATFACAKILTTNGWARGIPSFVCCMLCVMCIMYVVCCLLLLSCVSCFVRVVCARACMLLLCVSCMLRVRYHACGTVRADNVSVLIPTTRKIEFESCK